MNEKQEQNHEQNNTSLVTMSAESGAKKAGETFTNRALNALVDGVKKKYNEAQVLLGTAFTRYLNNAAQRYNQVRTLATGPTPRPLIGAGNVYVSIGVQYQDKTIATDSVDALLQLSNNILISGTGGVGKSMLMRYLFLNTANRGEYVPVLLELRRLSNQPSGQISVLDLIFSCMKDFDVQLQQEQFEYSLRLGKYLFLMDGFDEVKESQAKEAASAIQAFCSKYPKNACIITSRPRRETSPLETFTTVESKALSKEQAVLLASKIWKEDEKTKEFCRQLDSSLYKKHQDFAENPLLLSMMFLTFMRNNSVPNHLAEFYNKAYDALYSAHDSHDKGYYRREFKCNQLDETSFKLLLSHFCFQTYFKEDYEFSKEQVLTYLEKSIQKLGLTTVRAVDFLEDLGNVVCIIIKDGDIYRFSHRSFQTYFAACYTSKNLTDLQQKKLFSSLLSGRDTYYTREDYYILLAQIEPERFSENALEDWLREIQKDLEKSTTPHVFLLKQQYHAVELSKKQGEKQLRFYIGSYLRDDRSYKYYNVISLFRRHIAKLPYFPYKDEDLTYIYNCIEKLMPSQANRFGAEIDFKHIDSATCISEDERTLLYDKLARPEMFLTINKAINNWLASLDEKRANLDTIDFLDDL